MTKNGGRWSDIMAATVPDELPVPMQTGELVLPPHVRMLIAERAARIAAEENR